MSDKKFLDQMSVAVTQYPREESYWLRKLSGKPVKCTFPYDKIKEQNEMKREIVNFKFPPEISSRLLELSRDSDLKLHMILLAALCLLLHKYTGSPNIILGAPIYKQDNDASFINTILLIRNRLSRNNTFKELLLQVRQNMIEAEENQNYPLEILMKKLGIPETNGDKCPLFDIVVMLENVHYKKYIDHVHPNMIFSFLRENRDIELHLEYNSMLYQEETIERILSHLLSLLHHALFNADVKLPDISILSGDEKRKILYQFNNTDAKYPKNRSIQQLFDEQATRTPENMAVVGKGLGPGTKNQMINITYRELKKRSQQTADMLRKKGIRHNTIVGIMIERSLDMIIGFLGILESRGVYLPFDPDYPGERLQYMLADCNAKILLSQSSQASKLSKVKQKIELIFIDKEVDFTTHFPPIPQYTPPITHYRQVLPGIQPDRLCCVIYTSGSTGRPKGVLIKHRNIARLVKNSNYIEWTKADKILATGAIAFDITTFETWAPLLNGLTLYMADKDVILNVDRLGDFLAKNQVSILHLIPQLFNRLAAQNIKIFSGLKYFLVGGDLVNPTYINKVRRKYKNLKILHMYGPTENTTFSTYHPIDKEYDTSLPIGTPISNSTVYILDKYHRLVPVGVTGELCVAGDGVARGYLNNPELTAETFKRATISHSSFVIKEPGKAVSSHSLLVIGSPDKFSPNDRSQKFSSPNDQCLMTNDRTNKLSPHSPHSPIYRTGDLAKWQADGNILFMGRTDHQVKIRGFRVELEEIENQLLNYPGIKEAVVVPKVEETADKYLCAYIVKSVDFEKAASDTELREYLLQVLPPYMLPTYFVFLDRIPLTANGKVDRKSLQNSEIEPVGEEYIPPRNEMEKRLARIWQDVLGKKKIGMKDNFFMIGGDSIVSIQIASRMNKEGYKVRMTDIFHYPTIGQLAPLVTKSVSTAEQSVVTGKIPLTPVQKEFFQESRKNPHHFNNAIILFSQKGFEEEAIKTILMKIHQHHDALRMSFTRKSGEIVQFNHGLEYAFSMQVLDIRNETDEEIIQKTINQKAVEIQTAINLESGPLTGFALLFSNHGDYLLMVIHHLVIDTVSWRILLEDIEKLYRQYQKGQDLVLPPKTDSFKRWAESLSRYANSKEFLREKNYWEKLESKPVPGIKKDFFQPAYISDNTSHHFKLNQKETLRLQTKVNFAFGTEINDILLTALGLAIKKTWGINHLLVALEGHGREEILEGVDVSRTVGWFTSVYPILLDISDDRDLPRLIKKVKESLHQVPNKGIGYGILKYLTHETHKNSIRFQLAPRLSFNYLGQFDNSPEQQESSFQIANLPVGSTMSPEEKNRYELEVSGMITNKQLTISIDYNKKQYKTETIKTLVENYEAGLKNIIDFCSTRDIRQLTPSDLTYKKLSIEFLEHLQNQFEIEDVYPLTPMQEGILFHSLLEEKRSIYMEQSSYHLHGELDIYFIQKSLNQLCKRYDSLRTAFIHKGNDRPMQVVLQNRQINFYSRDIRAWSTKAQEKFIKEYKEKDRNSIFNLSNDSLMRLAVIQLDESRYEFIWTHHHILIDGWCLGILIADFFEIYNSYMENRNPRLLPVIPYKRYIQWLEHLDAEANRDYWKKYLEDYEEAAYIGILKNRQTSDEGYKNEQVISPMDMEKLYYINELACRNRVTLNNVFRAVWGILLGKYTGKEDVLFGAVVSGRPSEIEGVELMVGLFINTIPIRIRWEGKTTLKELLQKIQEEAINSEPHHHYPLAQIQAESLLKQDLLDHIFVFENYPIAEKLDGLINPAKKASEGTRVEVTGFSSVEVETNYDFNVNIFPGKDLILDISYNSDVYEKGVVERIVNHFNRVFDQIINDEEVKIEDIILLSGEEKRQILYEYNKTDAQFPRDKTIHGIFARQAAKSPHTIALFYENHHITYRTLNQRANQLARRLRVVGVRRKEIVGLILERSLEMVVCIIAVLKAGGAYLPIHPSHPGERKKMLIKENAPKALLCQGHLLEKINQLVGDDFTSKTICLESESIYTASTSNLDNLNQPDDLAYIMYTSGTTGKPNGILGEHRNVCSYVFGLNQRIFQRYQKHLYFSMVSPYVFDGSLKMIFGALFFGHTLFIVLETSRMDGQGLLDFIKRHRVEISDGTPSHLHLMSESPGGNCKLYLKNIMIAGDVLPCKAVKRFLERFGTSALEVSNAYGVTECCGLSTIYAISKMNIDLFESFPIGSPLPNEKVYIVNNKRQLQPVGIIGEICISGDGVTRGYLKRPELTAEKFKDDPFNEGKRMFCTGDLGRWLPDGNIEFAGRNDHQVKIRGYRIELEEIKNQLLKHPEVKEAVVLAREDKDAENDKYLCAYIILNDTDIITTDTTQIPSISSVSAKLREHLSLLLPEYMIPAYFVELKNIPLTPNGKVNRRALLKPESVSGLEYVPPRYEVEEKLAKIWSDVLGLQASIGIDDNFFVLGGHSLKATVMVSKIHKELNVKLPLVEVFKTPTIRGLSRYINKAAEVKYAIIQAVEEKEYYPLSSAQKRLYILQQMELSSTAYNMSEFIPFDGDAGTKKIKETFRNLIRRHESLRTCFHLVQYQPVQKIHNNVEFEIEYYDASQVEAEVTDKERTYSTHLTYSSQDIIKNFVRAFDLSKSPLLRIGLVKDGEGRQMLMVDMHHIISDGVSRQRLVEEFMAFFEGEEQKPLRIQYKDFAQWQNSKKEKKKIKQQENYWLKEFEGKIPRLDLPLDYQRPVIRSFEGDTVEFEISADQTTALKTMALAKGSTLFILLLAVFTVLLSKLSTQEDIVVGTPIAGRRHADMEKIIGMFVNTLVLRNYPGREKSFIEFLNQVKERTLEAFENQEYQFEDLVEQIIHERDSSRNPLFDTMFSLHTEIELAETPPTEKENTKSGNFTYKEQVSKFDLSLIGIETGETLSFTFEYCNKLFREESIKRYIINFKEIVAEVLKNNEIKIGDINISHGLLSAKNRVPTADFAF